MKKTILIPIQKFVNIDNLKWEIAILPISIVLLALGLKFLRLDKEDTITREA